jgi:2,3-bisphosphoglycerate-independent phosphoglycerate mutase
MKSISPFALVILDGFGYQKEQSHNAIAHAHTPHLTHWFATYPHTLLKASGPAVGLLPGTIGTSEVGHLTIGAGRVIPESVLRLHEEIDNGSFFKNPVLVNALKKIKESGKSLHLMGLLSDAGVHSHEKHLYALIKAACAAGIKNVYVHPFLDGRDVPPRSALTYLERLEKVLKKEGCGKIATIHGRFYAMDRDKNWERTGESYQVLTTPQKITYPSWKKHIEENYEKEIYDEFTPPFQVDPQGIVHGGDGIIFFNFRADRARQLTRCFTCPQTTPLALQKIPLAFFIGATEYDHDIPMEHLLTKQPLHNTLKEVLAEHHKTMFAIAETEKYAHVTYFFGGGREKEFSGETWKLIPSIKTKDYVHHPEMSAAKITDTVLDSLRQSPCNFYLINYANADMVGHSGNYDATVKAVECLDRELQRLYEVIVEKMHGTLYITADHGNAETMWDENAQQPKTSHTTNPVPFLEIKKGLEGGKEKLNLHELSDIAPFILQQMGLPIPAEMR